MMASQAAVYSSLYPGNYAKSYLWPVMTIFWLATPVSRRPMRGFRTTTFGPICEPTSIHGSSPASLALVASVIVRALPWAFKVLPLEIAPSTSSQWTFSVPFLRLQLAISTYW